MRTHNITQFRKITFPIRFSILLAKVNILHGCKHFKYGYFDLRGNINV